MGTLGTMGWRLRLEDEACCSLRSVPASFRWKTPIHGSGVWEHVPIYEPLLPWNQDANYMLSESTFLQQDLEACAFATSTDWGSKNPPSTPWPQFIFRFFSGQQLVNRMSSAWVSDEVLRYLSSPIHAITHTSLSSAFPVPQTHLSTFFSFQINSTWLKNIDSRHTSFPVSQLQDQPECPSTPDIKVDALLNRSIFIKVKGFSGQRPQEGIQSRR